MAPISRRCCNRTAIRFSGLTCGSAGKPSILSMRDRSLSQSARLDQQICASGRRAILVSTDPAGTTIKPSSGRETGSADPQTEQKPFTWRVPVSWNILILSSPGQPDKSGCGREQIGRMRRTAIFAAAAAMAQEKAVQLSRNTKCHCATQALSGGRFSRGPIVVHSAPSFSGCEISSSFRPIRRGCPNNCICSAQFRQHWSVRQPVVPQHRSV